MHPDAKNHAAVTSGGHTCLRTFVNLLIAEQFNEVIPMFLSPTPVAQETEIVFVCIGDKYAKTTSILDTALRYSPEEWYPEFENMHPNHRR